MSEQETKNASLDEVLALIDQLTPAQEAHIRSKLNDKFWSRRMQHLASGDVTRNIVGSWQFLIERLESGNIDEDIKESLTESWHHVVSRLASMAESLSGSWQSTASQTAAVDMEIQLETAYQELQSNLIKVRQAVAQAIATEKQLEQQLSKNRDQAATWFDRAAAALQQGNADLAEQARQRQSQYLNAVAVLEEELKCQKEHTAQLRQRLTELENFVQTAYVKKQVLIARDKAAQATAEANELLARMDTDSALSVLAAMEKHVAEREAAYVAAATLDRKQDSEQILIEATAALDQATYVMKRMEQLLIASEEKPKPTPDTGIT